MPDLITFSLAKPTILLNPWQRMHWATRREYSIALAWEVRAAIGAQMPRAPFERARLVVRRMSLQEPDTDGLYGGLKPLIDSLIVPSRRHPFGIGVIVDDCASRLTLDARHVQVGKRKLQGTIAEVHRL